MIYIQALENFFASAYEIDEMDLAPPEKLRFLIRNHIENIIIGNLPMFAMFFSEENQLSEKQFQRIRPESVEPSDSGQPLWIYRNSLYDPSATPKNRPTKA